MATKVEIQWFIDSLSHKTNILTPIIEWIVNSIHAIENGKWDWEIIVEFKRDETLITDDDKWKPFFNSIEITDNWVWFNDENIESFETIYSRLKKNKWWKWFWRITFLKYFKDIHIESTCKSDQWFKDIQFRFVPEKEIIKDKIVKDSWKQKSYTKLYLNDIKETHRYELDKSIETIWRKILEKLLVYFISDSLPKIIFTETYKWRIVTLTLNDLIKKDWEIDQFKTGRTKLKSENKEISLNYHLFKVFHTNWQNSTIKLVAHNREVTSEPLHNYISEFKENFNDQNKWDFIIRAYVTSDYFDDNIDQERWKFNFPKSSSWNIYFPFTQEEIESHIVEIIEQIDILSNEITTRKDKKKKRVNTYLDKRYRHNWYRNKINYDEIWYGASETEIEMYIQRIIASEETKLFQWIKQLESFKWDTSEKVEELVQLAWQAWKDRLANYVWLRKCILDLLKDSLKINPETGKYKSEDTVHSIIYPTKRNSDNTWYFEHNLRLIDEKLNFTEFITSDIPFWKWNNKRWDIIIFDKPCSFRWDNNKSNPLHIIEFKKPARTDFVNNSKSDDEPIWQVINYAEKLRDWKFKTTEWLTIEIDPHTPFYWYIVCEINETVKKRLKKKDMKPLPDWEWYYDFHWWLNMYIKIISWKKLIKDAEQNNSIFFKKLWIDSK